MFLLTEQLWKLKFTLTEILQKRFTINLIKSIFYKHQRVDYYTWKIPWKWPQWKIDTKLIIFATVFLLVEFLFTKGKIWQICKLYEKRIHHRCSPTESYKRPCDSFSRVYLDNSLKCLENNKETFSPLHFSATWCGYRYSMQRKHLLIFWVAGNSKVLPLRFLWRPVYTYVSNG